MGRKTWVEVSCDLCGSAEHFVPGNVNANARAHGWTVTRKGQYFCSAECLQKAREVDSLIEQLKN